MTSTRGASKRAGTSCRSCCDTRTARRSRPGSTRRKNCSGHRCSILERAEAAASRPSFRRRARELDDFGPLVRFFAQELAKLGGFAFLDVAKLELRGSERNSWFHANSDDPG